MKADRCFTKDGWMARFKPASKASFSTEEGGILISFLHKTTLLTKLAFPARKKCGRRRRNFVIFRSTKVLPQEASRSCWVATRASPSESLPLTDMHNIMRVKYRQWRLHFHSFNLPHFRLPLPRAVRRVLAAPTGQSHV